MAGGHCEGESAEALGIIEYWMPISDYKKPNNNFNINKDFRFKKYMTIAQKRKQGR